MADKRKVVTPVFRASFIHVLKPKVNKKQDEKTGNIIETSAYEVTMIFEPSYEDPKEQERLEALKQLVEDTIFDKYNKPSSQLGFLMKRPLRPGVQVTEERLNGFDLNRYPEYEGKIIASARSYGNFPPEVVSTRRGADGKFVPITDPNEVYSGAWMRASVTAYISRNYPKTVSLGLVNVQKVRDGEPLGTARGSANSDFESFVDEDEIASGNNDDLLGL